jgi:hypothetical protein
MITACLLMLLPYFAYVFRFVSPHQVIHRIRSEALARVRRAGDGDVRETKRAVIAAVEELEDIARSAMQHSDRGIAMTAVAALADLLADVTQMRRSLPQGLVSGRRDDHTRPGLRFDGGAGPRGDCTRRRVVRGERSCASAWRCSAMRWAARATSRA